MLAGERVRQGDETSTGVLNSRVKKGKFPAILEMIKYQ